MNSRRQFLRWTGSLAAALSFSRLTKPAPAAAAPDPPRVDLAVIGTGFGGSMTSLYITHTWEAQHASGAAGAQPPLKVLLLERGTWWTTPVETVQDKEVRTRELLFTKGEPTQEWSTANDLRGSLDLLERCRRTDSRPQGLYDFTTVGRRGILGRQNDGVAVLRASGVGGGSLVYSNITVRPPETLFQDPRWPGVWGSNQAERDRLYALARNAIGYGVQYAIEAAKPNPNQAVLRSTQVNTGLSRIITRSARLKPSWNQNFQIVVPAGAPPTDPHPAELIDRARVFQTAVSQMSADGWGTVDLAINDIAPEGTAPEKLRGRNYCERQGRCNVGCLPGARHTLNKQLIRALYGTLDANRLITPPTDPNPNPKPYLRHVDLSLWTLTDIDYISALPAGGYRIHYQRGNLADPRQRTAGVVEATRVIVAAGCVGTTELMLRSDARAKQTNGQEGLAGLSLRLGHAFSTNGDYIAFLSPTREHVNLTRGPVTTSFAHFGAAAPRSEGFVNLEDQGIPRALAGLTGYGIPVMQALAHGRSVIQIGAAIQEIGDLLRGLLTLHTRRHTAATSPADLSGDRPEAGEELTAQMMCVVAQGKEGSLGQFWLDGTRLRARRTDGKAFHEDPIYGAVRAALARLAALIRDPKTPQATFQSPFVDVGGLAPIIATSHPLGGCPMGADVSAGVVDEWGRIFRSGGGVYRGLYIADASVIPTALGVNPSLTISAVALRIAEGIVKDMTAP